MWSFTIIICIVHLYKQCLVDIFAGVFLVSFFLCCAWIFICLQCKEYKACTKPHITWKCLNLQQFFHGFLWTTKILYFRSCIVPSASPLTSLLSYISLKNNRNKSQQAHVGMEHSKNSQTRWCQHHNTFTCTILTSCAISPCVSAHQHALCIHAALPNPLPPMHYSYAYAIVCPRGVKLRQIVLSFIWGTNVLSSCLFSMI